MSIQELEPLTKPQRTSSPIDIVRGESAATPLPQPRPRPFGRVAMHWTRRTHLYLGLFLFPWAVLYGVTGFLFNHPTVFSDQNTRSFTQQDWGGTPLAEPMTASAIAQEVVDALKKRSPEAANYALVNPEQATFVRELATASVKAEGQQVSVFLDVLGRGGFVRSSPSVEQPASEKPPFAVGEPSASRQRGMGMMGGMSMGRAGKSEKLTIDNPLPDRIKQAVPSLLTKLGYPTGEVTVGTVPDLVFHIQADGKTWVANYNSVTGSVSGRTIESPGEPLSIRRFLTRLHLAHGYTYSLGARWVWAVFVDLMAFVMLFWGGSGLLMWWQIKMTRRWGLMAVAASVVIAVLLTMGMWQVLSL